MALPARATEVATKKKFKPEDGYEERKLSPAEWLKLRASCKPTSKTFAGIAALQRTQGTLYQNELLPEELAEGSIWGFQNRLNAHFLHTRLPYKVVTRKDGETRVKTELGRQHQPINPRIVLLTKKS